MSIRAARRGVSRRGAVLLPILAMVFLTASSPQCARTSDRALNPVSSAASAQLGSCISGCTRDAAEARSLELDEFVAEMKACETEECWQETATEHVAILMAIQYEFKICMTVCHDQGAATGGN